MSGVYLDEPLPAAKRDRPTRRVVRFEATQDRLAQALGLPDGVRVVACVMSRRDYFELMLEGPGLPQIPCGDIVPLSRAAITDTARMARARRWDFE